MISNENEISIANTATNWGLEFYACKRNKPGPGEKPDAVVPSPGSSGRYIE
jgi:hypothetical protein